ncbi:MAG TPA: TetR/AcrR family transcriptional regulator [Acidimicrobiia bacterium]|nr:TetR/AcrR family transcriptional regulator [Acidimicrobiia bacterium]
MATETASDAGTDGRTARAARTRDAVVEALLSLIDEGDVRPPARRVAERAGVSLRSVYVHFDDLEDLYCAAAKRQYRRISALVVTLPTDGPLDARLRAFVDQRARVLEAGAPVRRAGLFHAVTSPTLARVMHVSRKAGRAEVEKVFGTELDTYARDATERRHLLAALTTAASAATWETLREHEQLGIDDAAAVMHDMLAAILASRRPRTAARRGGPRARAAPRRARG